MTFNTAARYFRQTLIAVLIAAPLTAAFPPRTAAADQDWRAFASMDDAEVVMAEALIAITDKASRDLLNKPVDRRAMADTFRRIGWKVRTQLLTGGSREAAEALRHAVFTVEGLVPDHDFSARAEAATAVLSEVLDHKRGVCLSLSLIYLAAAEEAALPVRGVSVPTHFFVRYHDGRDRLNLETLDRGGNARSDNFYRGKFFVRKGEPFYLRSLTAKESLAVYLSQLAAIYNRSGLSEQAVELLETAAAASPSDPEVRTNLGVALRSAGRSDDAVEAWRTAIILDPYDDVAHYNLAAGLADQGRWLEAIHHFDESMRLGHAYDIRLLRRLEPHRPDALYTRSPREERLARKAAGSESSREAPVRASAPARRPSAVLISQEPKA
jgi:tetratricopeptide (TPR) repeat protein